MYYFLIAFSYSTLLCTAFTDRSVSVIEHPSPGMTRLNCTVPTVLRVYSTAPHSTLLIVGYTILGYATMGGRAGYDIIVLPTLPTCTSLQNNTPCIIL